MIWYKKGRTIAFVVLASIMLTLLLSLNFHIWSGSYVEGDLESVVMQQMKSLENGDVEGCISGETSGRISSRISIKSSARINDKTYPCFEGCICLLVVAAVMALHCGRSPWICREEFFLRPGVTLQSLWVRMDD